jgi:hypothetical protein
MASLQLMLLPPLAGPGQELQMTITADDAPETTVTVSPPDTVVLEGPKTQVVGTGKFQATLRWRIAHVQPNTTTLVEFEVSAGGLSRKALCKVVSK